ncbi:Holliday junction DNA helicase subunit RuvB [Thermovibrio guaymasensis]|uniref:Holliday junction branch migration complex subunit RuvB n=1 Tax=Thermovibrio guaymasensis TaxID=240167 RepID=A0A420W6W0_9BACT|nr:Holliday junction branch migration DNA helicase RuvB [Thermovibrio guaymasensis]RKQ61823.1 Holliday junction DNA helicase subunit RuvB [Thermovibrio guaymasensis]
MIERPKRFSEFIGQERVKRVLKVAVESARRREEPLDHVLFYGPPGTGKTTLSTIIAKELDREIKMVSAPTIERKGDLLGILTSLKEGDVLFIDEIHRLNRAVEETLYSAMEDFRVDVVMGGKRTVSIEIPPFTLIGATTRLNLLTPPLRSRFGIVCRLELYTPDEMKEVARRGGEKLKLNLDEEALELLGRCSRGTPRILNQILKRVRDYATVHNWEKVGKKEVEKVLGELGIDSYGLDRLDRKILETIAKVFKGGPVGLTTLATVLKEDPETIENVHEPYLIEMGFIVKTPRGRMLTEKAWAIIKR